MALVTGGFDVKVKLVDQGGNESQLGFTYRSTDFTTIRTHVTATLVPAVAAITKCAVAGASISESIVEDTFAIPTNGAEIENQALLVARLATEGKTVNIRIPGPDDGIMVGASGADYNLVDGSDAALLAFYDMFQEVAAAGDSVLTISDGEELHPTNPHKSGKRIHRASRKG